MEREQKIQNGSQDMDQRPPASRDPGPQKAQTMHCKNAEIECREKEEKEAFRLIWGCHPTIAGNNGTKFLFLLGSGFHSHLFPAFYPEFHQSPPG